VFLQAELEGRYSQAGAWEQGAGYCALVFLVPKLQLGNAYRQALLDGHTKLGKTIKRSCYKVLN